MRGGGRLEDNDEGPAEGSAQGVSAGGRPQTGCATPSLPERGYERQNRGSLTGGSVVCPEAHEDVRISHLCGAGTRITHDR